MASPYQQNPSMPAEFLARLFSGLAPPPQQYPVHSPQLANVGTQGMPQNIWQGLAQGLAGAGTNYIDQRQKQQKIAQLLPLIPKELQGIANSLTPEELATLAIQYSKQQEERAYSEGQETKKHAQKTEDELLQTSQADQILDWRQKHPGEPDPKGLLPGAYTEADARDTAARASRKEREEASKQPKMLEELDLRIQKLKQELNRPSLTEEQKNQLRLDLHKAERQYDIQNPTPAEQRAEAQANQPKPSPEFKSDEQNAKDFLRRKKNAYGDMIKAQRIVMDLDEKAKAHKVGPFSMGGGLSKKEREVYEKAKEDYKKASSEYQEWDRQEKAIYDKNAVNQTKQGFQKLDNNLTQTARQTSELPLPWNTRLQTLKSFRPNSTDQDIAQFQGLSYKDQLDFLNHLKDINQ